MSCAVSYDQMRQKLLELYRGNDEKQLCIMRYTDQQVAAEYNIIFDLCGGYGLYE